MPTRRTEEDPKRAQGESEPDYSVFQFNLKGSIIEVTGMVVPDRKAWTSRPESRSRAWASVETTCGQVLAVRLFG